jgi:hypothetical protein
MSNRPPKGNQVDTINRGTPFTQMSLDLKKVDAMANSYGVDFAHFAAIPSPIGQKDRGDYRRSDGVDTITSNGFIYTCIGKFTATMIDNTSKEKDSEAGQVEASESRLVLPRFYNAGPEQSAGKRIYMHPGDRVYIGDVNADDRVIAFHKMDYDPFIDNVAMYAVCAMDMPIVDSLNRQYYENLDFAISTTGNIHWLPTGQNPGVDPETGKGRVYSVRYLYRAYWYVISLPKEVRITNTTTNGVRGPERMPYHAVCQREYIYHQQNRGDAINQNKTTTPDRVGAAPVPVIVPNSFVVQVDMSSIADDSGTQGQS